MKRSQLRELILEEIKNINEGWSSESGDTNRWMKRAQANAEPAATEVEVVDPNFDFPTIWDRILKMVNDAPANEQMFMLNRLDHDLKHLVRK
jgi:hypothetical protein